jgi:hypothetical protein
MAARLPQAEWGVWGEEPPTKVNMLQLNIEFPFKDF